MLGKVILWVNSSEKDGFIGIKWFKYTLLTYMDRLFFKDYVLFINKG